MEIRECEILFDTSPSGKLDAGWQSGVLKQRAKTTKAGNQLYVASYPIWDTATAHKAREAVDKLKGQKGTTEAQKRLNARNAQNRLAILTNANFGEGDLLVTSTYPEGGQPEDAKRAGKNMVNYINRIKTLRRRYGLPEMKYIYVTEVTESEARGTRYHHHMILSGDGVTREEIESLWTGTHGGISNTRRTQWQPTGLTGFAHYITKQTGGTDRGKGQSIATKRRWCASKNLVMPKPTTADKKISRRRVERIASDVEQEAKAIFEKLYPGYEFVEARVKISSFVSGAYIYATLCKREEKPQKRRKGTA